MFWDVTEKRKNHYTMYKIKKKRLSAAFSYRRLNAAARLANASLFARIVALGTAALFPLDIFKSGVHRLLF